MSDTLATESSPLDIDGAAAVFANALEIVSPEPEKKEPEPNADPEGVKEPEATEETEEATEEVEEQADDETITIEVDGKPVEIKKSELPDLYKGNLRQSDYTKKTMEAAEQRKAADAEIAQARAARQEFAQKNAEAIALLSAQLTEQQNTDWEQLLNTDPVEYMRQTRIFDQRQAALQKAQQDQQVVRQQAQAEQATYLQKFVLEQQEHLLAKLPEWKDEGKAKAEKAQLREYLKEMDYSDDEIGQAADHRMILIARDAMRFREMMAKAKAASKKVENVPKRVVTSGQGTAQPLDKRSVNFQRLAKSGSVEDAARIFSSLI